jgi:hypothetical protein
MKLQLNNQISNYPIQHIVVYGSWINWKYGCLFCPLTFMEW